MKRLLLIFSFLLAGCTAANDDPAGEYPLVASRESTVAPPTTELGSPSTVPPPATFDENAPGNNPSSSSMNMNESQKQQ